MKHDSRSYIRSIMGIVGKMDTAVVSWRRAMSSTTLLRNGQHIGDTKSLVSKSTQQLASAVKKYVLASLEAFFLPVAHSDWFP